MKWFWLVAVSCLVRVHPLFALFGELTKIENTARQKIASVEEKLTKLEQELGIKQVPVKMVLSVFGDFLYWKASLDGVAYATTAVIVRNPDGSEGFDRFKTRTVHFEYDPGFSIGAGMGLPYDQWDVSLRWLRFHTEGRDKARGSSVEAVGDRVVLDLIGMLESVVSSPHRATADCKIHLDVVDLVLGRAFFWSRYFEFRPFAGLRGAWVDLDWDIAFTTPTSTPSPIDQSSAFLNVDNNFNAIGFLGGFESKWSFYKGLGLFSYATASLIYGKSSERTKEDFFFIPALETTTFEQTLKARNSTHTMKSVFDIALGLKWEIHFKKHDAFQIRAGYEFFYWPNVTQKTIAQETRIRDRADLSFQGLIMGGRFDF
jgi:hypothetical protein